MMRVSEAAAALGVTHHGADVVFTAVGTDSRNVKAGELFIALRGQHFDAHQHIAAAQAAGAVAVVADAQGAPLAPTGMPLITVENTRQALTRLAFAWRSRFSGPLVALIGCSPRAATSITKSACR